MSPTTTTTIDKMQHQPIAQSSSRICQPIPVIRFQHACKPNAVWMHCDHCLGPISWQAEYGFEWRANANWVPDWIQLETQLECTLNTHAQHVLNIFWNQIESNLNTCAQQPPIQKTIQNLCLRLSNQCTQKMFSHNLVDIHSELTTKTYSHIRFTFNQCVWHLRKLPFFFNSTAVNSTSALYAFI